MYRVVSTVPRTVARFSTRPAASAAARRFYASGSHISGDDPETIELEKKRNLSKEQEKTSTPHEFAPGWNEHLASVSEAYVKADKDTGTLHDLQTKTVDYIKKRHSTTDPSTGKKTVDEIEETFERDAVGGPLGAGANGGEHLSTDQEDELEGPLRGRP